MNAERLLQHYEQIADAPDAIARLRRFILDLAVRGKLVPQDPSDEPASELLKRIMVEKERLAKAGEIRKPKALEPVDRPPFELPHSWNWVRIRQVTSDRGQEVPTDAFTYIDVGAINKEEGVVGEPSILNANDAPSRARKVVRRGDVIYSCVRPYLLNIAVIDTDFVPKPIASTAFAVLNGHGYVVPRYIWTVLRSPFMVECVEETQRGLAYPAINDADFAVLPFPLPPLAEQHRIVAKVDELMALCDKLEGARTERETKRDRLAAASLARLNTPDPETFRDDARFALDALPALTARPDQIKQLRQTILNLAVRGKLVPQDPADEKSNLRPPSDSDQHEAIPLDWSYARLKNLLSEDTRNGYSRKPDDALDGHPILRISAGTIRQDGVLAEEEHKLISGIDSKALLQYGLQPGDLLACRFNGNKAYVGRMTIFRDYLGLKPIYPDKLIRIRTDRSVAIPEYLRLASESDLVRAEIESICATTVGNWGVSASNLKEVRFPLPPLAEQRRIVAKVDELMALCDQLETSLTSADETRKKLLDALLAEALAPVDADALQEAAQ
ncbi:restriction endonuclease subunit S [Microvirga tunisiensis]|uniref:Restriction endonuclease subunit S n=1 Tax=Pannonibacter tanglangensis TaxID=2750084 RepID=A0A7X5F5U1_9HYPH|nr:restriction endonuclease subunit S [Pannonibacter sp. XCT-53]NBN80301.1 restriction endonuclease subunit S [Pannonibacter sp. XCT-53]